MTSKKNIINKATKPKTQTNKIPYPKTLQSIKRVRTNQKYPTRQRVTRSSKHQQHVSLYALIRFDDDAEGYNHATAKDDKEAGELLDHGFQYVCTTPQGVMMFRKHK